MQISRNARQASLRSVWLLRHMRHALKRGPVNKESKGPVGPQDALVLGFKSRVFELAAEDTGLALPSGCWNWWDFSWFDWAGNCNQNRRLSSLGWRIVRLEIKAPGDRVAHRSHVKLMLLLWLLMSQFGHCCLSSYVAIVFHHHHHYYRPIENHRNYGSLFALAATWKRRTSSQGAVRVCAYRTRRRRRHRYRFHPAS